MNPLLAIFDEYATEIKVCSSPVVVVTRETMRVSGCNYPDVHGDSDKMANLAYCAYSMVGFRGVRIPFDLFVEAEALGSKIQMGGKRRPPVIKSRAFRDKGELVVPPNIFDKGRFRTVFDAIKILKKKVEGKVPIYVGAVGPLTLVNSLYGESRLRSWLEEDPDLVTQNLMLAAAFQTDYAERLLEAGADVLVILEPTASDSKLGRAHFANHLLPTYKELRRRIRGPIILHVCGSTRGILDLVAQTGFDAYSFEAPYTSVREAKARIGNKMALVGNIATFDTLLFGTPEQVYEQSIIALEDGINILSPGCGVPIQTPLQNLKAMVRAAQEFSSRQASRISA